jgi:hypothetical protein
LLLRFWDSEVAVAWPSAGGCYGGIKIAERKKVDEIITRKPRSARLKINILLFALRFPKLILTDTSASNVLNP